ncbi:Tetraspanin-18 [Sesamum angolense]|uniref:Tetraspanin-18 n=1 Tax=Sesamum angolense TaxID=2727404 RepID=A0AAE1XB11_9LAMI|nr:Tetraspanin-18 [Sesamum angolense]
MGTSSCQTFMAFILKFLNFLQAFVGVAMIIYSAYMLSQWQHRPDEFPSPAPLHDVSGIPSSDDVVNHLNLALSDNALHINFHSSQLRDYILTCEIASLKAVLVGLVALVAFDRHWKKDVPFDPTGELDSLMAFIEDNMDMLKSTRMLASIMFTEQVSVFASEKRECEFWEGNKSVIGVHLPPRAVQLPSHNETSFLFMVSSRDVDDDIEAEYDYSSREPLLIPRPSQACGSPRGDSDIWSSRMRQKYGLNTVDSKTQFTESKPVH